MKSASNSSHVYIDYPEFNSGQRISPRERERELLDTGQKSSSDTVRQPMTISQVRGHMI